MLSCKGFTFSPDTFNSEGRNEDGGGARAEEKKRSSEEWRGVNGFSTHFYGGGERLNTVTIGGRGIGALWGKGRGDFTPSAVLVGGGDGYPTLFFPEL